EALDEGQKLLARGPGGQRVLPGADAHLRCGLAFVGHVDFGRRVFTYPNDRKARREAELRGELGHLLGHLPAHVGCNGFSVDDNSAHLAFPSWIPSVAAGLMARRRRWSRVLPRRRPLSCDEAVVPAKRLSRRRAS